MILRIDDEYYDKVTKCLTDAFIPYSLTVTCNDIDEAFETIDEDALMMFTKKEEDIDLFVKIGE